MCLKVKHNGDLKVKMCTHIFHLQEFHIYGIICPPFQVLKKILSLSLDQRCRNWGKEKLSDLWMSGLVSDVSGIQIQTFPWWILFHYITRKFIALLLFFICNYRINPGNFRTFKNQLTLQKVETNVSLLFSAFVRTQAKPLTCFRTFQVHECF